MKYKSLALLTSAMFSQPINAINMDRFDYLAFGWLASHYDGLDFVPGGLTGEALSFSVDESDPGFRISFGHQFNAYCAIEGSFTKHGKPNFVVRERSLVADPETEEEVEQFDAVLKGEHSARSIDLRLVLTYPLGETFFLRAHAGISAWQREYERLSSEASLALQTTDDSDYSPTYGAGFGYGLNRKWALFFDFERSEFGTIETSGLAVSIAYRL